MKGKRKVLGILFYYLKDEKVKLFWYLLLVFLTYIPALSTSFFWGYAIEGLISNDFNKFLIFLIFKQGTDILFHSLLSLPRDSLYNYLEIKFSKNVIKDLYSKIQELPAIAFEDIGVGEFINRMTTDPDRIMQLLSKLIKMSCRLFVAVFLVFLSIL